MRIEEKSIQGVYEITLDPRRDDRGFFMRTYDKKIFQEFGLDSTWVQENHSFSKDKGTVRGLHFQYAPDCEKKLLRAISGEVYMVAVDLRKASPTLGAWTSVTLSGEKNNIFVVPRGCAPGMCTLTENCVLTYKVDNFYNPKNEESLLWNDSDIGIVWPVSEPSVISDRDKYKSISFKEFMEKCGGILSGQ